MRTTCPANASVNRARPGMSLPALTLVTLVMTWGWPASTTGWVLGCEPSRIGADAQSGANANTASTSPAQAGTAPALAPASPLAEKSQDRPRRDARKIYQRMLRASAWVTVRLSPSETHSGSAWLVDSKERLLVTSHHVVSSKDLWAVHDNRIKVFFPETRKGMTLSDPEAVLREGKPYSAHIVDSDPGRDLAILQVEQLPADLEPLPLSQEGCQPAESVHSIGNSGGQALWVYTSGTVRQVFRKDLLIGSLRKIRVTCVETQTPINPGDSGGPVVNDDGQVVAVNTLGRSLVGVPSSPIAVAVDVSEVRALLDEVRPFLHPVNSDDYNRRGLHYLSRERISPALEDFSEALKRLPAGADRAPILRNRGRAYSVNGVRDRSIQDLTQALDLKPRDLETLVARGEAYLLAWNFRAAQADFKMAIQDAESAHVQSDLLARAHFGLSMVQFHDKDNASSRDSLNRAIRFDPENFTYHVHRAARLISLQQADKAAEDVNQAIKIAANDVDSSHWFTIQRLLASAYHNRGVAHTLMKRGDLALADYKMALKWTEKVLPGAHPANNALAIAKQLYNLGYFQEAKDAFSRAEKISPLIASQRKVFIDRKFCLVNKSLSRITLHFKYHAWTKDNQRAWLPGELWTTDWAKITIDPGKAGLLVVDGSPIEADRIRMVIRNEQNETLNERFYKDDLVLAPQDGYSAYMVEALVMTYP